MKKLSLSIIIVSIFFSSALFSEEDYSKHYITKRTASHIVTSIFIHTVTQEMIETPGLLKEILIRGIIATQPILKKSDMIRVIYKLENNEVAIFSTSCEAFLLYLKGELAWDRLVLVHSNTTWEPL
jgi:hypothetical protein